MICTDKTGTLTENRMSVEHLWYDRSVFHAASTMGVHMQESGGAAVAAAVATTGGPTEETEVPPPMQQTLASAAVEGDEAEYEGGNTETAAFTISGPRAVEYASRHRRGTPPWRAFSPHAKLLAISVLCNRARPTDAPPTHAVPGATERALTGTAADAALWRYAEIFFAVASARAQFPRLFDVPFSSATKFAATVVADRADPGGQHIVMLKGAPEIIMQRCSTWLHGKELRAIDDAFREQARRRLLASVLACCTSEPVFVVCHSAVHCGV